MSRVPGICHLFIVSRIMLNLRPLLAKREHNYLYYKLLFMFSVNILVCTSRLWFCIQYTTCSMLLGLWKLTTVLCTKDKTRIITSRIIFS